MNELNFIPDPMCTVIQRDGKIWVLAMFWSVKNEANMDGDVVVMHEAASVTAKALGRDARVALGKYSVQSRDAVLPRDPIELISDGKVKKFTKGLMGVMIAWLKDKEALLVNGSYAPTSYGFVNHKQLKPIPFSITDEELGAVILEEFKRVRKRERLS